MDMTVETEIQTPTVACRRIDWRDPSSAEEALQRFRGCDGCDLAQAWLPALAPDYRPTRVRTAWNGTDLFVLAELEDDDPFNPVVVYNEPSFQSGDVFEIFIRPTTQQAYYEFHVTPGNQTFQLRFPSAKAFREAAGRHMPEDWYLAAPVMTSRTWIVPERKGWLALARIPCRRISETEPVREGSQWRFSFSRYDYTRGSSSPVLSSSSPHAVCNFHRQGEWGLLVFE